MHPSLNPFQQKNVPVIVVQFQVDTQINPDEQGGDMIVSEGFQQGWAEFKSQFPDLTLQRLYPKVKSHNIQASVDNAALNDKRIPLIKDPTTFFKIVPKSIQDFEELLLILKKLPNVENVYPISGPTPPPTFNPGNDPLSFAQGYLKPAPEGIDMFFAQGLEGGDGLGVNFIDIEQGWILSHEDLIDAKIQLLGKGLNHCFFGHGTAVLGQIVATDNETGIVGIARGCRVNVVSQFDSEGVYNTAGAILAAVELLEPGDVLLIEAQAPVIADSGNNFPVEVEEPTFNALVIAYTKGIIVIEAAGNGDDRNGNDLDNLFFEGIGDILNRNGDNFMDSGAIVVAAASSNVPHERLPFSNYGSRIDCYAWGENIVTTGDGFMGTGLTDYTSSFGGTSGASPIIAGAAIVIQAIQRALGGVSIIPDQMREILSNPETSTLSHNPESDKIGVMPDLRKIINRLFFDQIQ